MNSLLKIAVCGILGTVAAQDCKVNRPFDIEFWKLQNMIRTHPKLFVPFLQDWLSRFETDTLYKTV